MAINVNENRVQQPERKSYVSQPQYYVANMPSNRYVRQPQQDMYVSTTREQQPRRSKLKMPGQGGNTLQTVATVAGIAASTLIAASLLKSSNLFNKQNDVILDQIKKFEAPDKVKDKMQDAYRKMKNSVMDADSSKNYIENVKKLCFKDPELKPVDTKKARAIMDEELTGMNKVKDQVINFLEERNYNLANGIKNENGPLILCLDGPPGCGKTSVAELIAKAMDVPFERISLAGVSDSMAVTGLPQGYKDAHPGEIIKAFQDAKCKNPVILFDEMDKMGASREHGSPAAALLDVLEPKQCKNFTDKYMEFPYDLSQATFIITSNEKANIDKTLLDRVKVIDMKAFTTGEKETIAQKFLSKLFGNSKLENHGVKKFTDGAVKAIVENTDDAGARKTIQNCKDVIKQAKVDIQRGAKGSDLIIDENYVNKALEGAAAKLEKSAADNGISVEDYLKAIQDATK
jgi:ATP-dependent Lon protease